MRKNLKYKEQIVKSYNEKIARSSLAVFFDFTGIDAQAITRLRASIKEANGEVLVGKNTLFYRAFMNTVMVDHREVFAGPTAIAFAYEDPVKVAKTLYEFMKELDKDKPLLRIKGAYMQGRFLKPADLQALAELPPKEVLVSKLMGAIQGPIYALVMALKAVPQKLVLTIKAIEEKKSNKEV